MGASACVWAAVIALALIARGAPPPPPGPAPPCSCAVCEDANPLPPRDGRVRIAAVGDSITRGHPLKGADLQFNYPCDLQRLLGEDKYEVLNFGAGGTTMFKPAGLPKPVSYWNTSQFRKAQASKADMVLIMLGTNDAVSAYWEVLNASYAPDYAAMVNLFRGLGTKHVYAMTSPPLYNGHFAGISQKVVNTILPGLVAEVAQKTQLPPAIPIFPGMGGPNLTHHDWFWGNGSYGCHPNKAGYAGLSSIVYKYLQSQPLLMSPARRPSRLAVQPSKGTRVERRPWDGKVCDVTQFGAKAVAGHNNAAAIQAAIKACGSYPDGGTVLLPATGGLGSSETVYESGPVWLASNTVFFIDSGVRLLGSANKDNATWPTIYTRRGGTMGFTRASLINGARCLNLEFDASQAAPACEQTGVCAGDQCKAWGKLENVTLAGGGTIDGNGDSGWWKDKELEAVRPALLGLLWIDGLTIRDLTLTNPAFWTTHPTFCSNVYITKLHIQTVGVPNGDGIDPDSCSNVLIEECYVSTGDDCIAIKSGKNADGLAVGIPTQNVTVRNMVFGQGHGVSIGSETSGSILNVSFVNLTLDGTENGVRIKSCPGRGGAVKGISYTNLVIKNVGEAIRVNEDYCHDGTDNPQFSDFLVENLTASKVKTAGEFVCLSAAPCRGIVLRNVAISDYEHGFTCSSSHGSATNVTPPACLTP